MTESPIKVYPAKLPYRKWQGGSVSEPTQFKGLRTIDKPEQPNNVNYVCEKCKDTGQIPQKSPNCACVYCKNGLDDCQIKIPCPDCAEQPIKSKEEAERVADEYFKTTEQPAKSSPEAKEKITPIIEPETGGENNKVAGQPLEQPNQVIIKTIQGLMTVVNDNLEKLRQGITNQVPGDSCRKMRVLQALEDIDIFEKTTLFKLQKAFE